MGVSLTRSSSPSSTSPGQVTRPATRNWHAVFSQGCTRGSPLRRCLGPSDLEMHRRIASQKRRRRHARPTRCTASLGWKIRLLVVSWSSRNLGARTPEPPASHRTPRASAVGYLLQFAPANCTSEYWSRDMPTLGTPEHRAAPRRSVGGSHYSSFPGRLKRRRGSQSVIRNP